jgi:ATP-dependent helicase HrpA
VKRTDFKLDMLPAHLFMNFRVVDEHGRQLGRAQPGRAQGRAGRAGARAFQALAGLKAAKPAGGRSFATSRQNEAPAGVHQAQAAIKPVVDQAPAEDARHTRWDFGELPELLEIGARARC